MGEQERRERLADQREEAQSAVRMPSNELQLDTRNLPDRRPGPGLALALELQLVPTHPDRSGGLGFLALVGKAFAPFLLAQGAVLAGMIADRIFFTGAKLPDFKMEIVGLVALMVFAVFGPLLVFSPRLAALKRAGLYEYGTLAQRYVREFKHKWLRGGAPADEPFVGSADIQSLADLGNSFESLQNMRAAPFTLRALLELTVVTLVPLLPLSLTMVSLQQLLDRVIKPLF